VASLAVPTLPCISSSMYITIRTDDQLSTHIFVSSYLTIDKWNASAFFCLKTNLMGLYTATLTMI